MSEGASRVWTVPNIISVVRLAGVPLFLWLVLGPEADAIALVVLMVAGFTDFLDGWLARRLDQYSTLGEILDPVADRLYILAVVVGLYLRDIIPWWVAIALPLRDLFLWGLVPLLRTRLDLAAAGGEQGELRADEEGVEGQEHDGEAHAEEVTVHRRPPPPAPGRGGRCAGRPSAARSG